MKQSKTVRLLDGPHDGREITVLEDSVLVGLVEQTEKVDGKWVADRSFYSKISAEEFEFSHTVTVPIKIIKVIGGSRAGVIDMPEDDISEFLTIFRNEEYTVTGPETMEMTQATGDVYRYIDGEYRLSHTTVYPRGQAPTCGDCGGNE